MKKTLFIAALLVAGVATISATEYTAYAEITLNKTLKLREAAEFSAAFDNGAEMARFNNTGIFAYANITGQSATEWIQFATNDLEGTVLAFKVAAAGEQTLTFSAVQGAQLYLVDAVADKYIAIKNGESYTFTAEAADAANWNTTRFSISKNPPYLFVGNKLVLGDKKPGSVAKAKSFEYQDGKRVFTGHDVSGDGATLLLFQPSYYEVTYTNRKDEEKKFIVNVNPTVTPVN